MPAFLVLCGIGGLAIFSSTIAKNPVLPILAQQIGATKDVIGWVAAASTVTGILASLPAGWLSDRVGRKPLILAAGFVFLTAPLLYFFINNPLQLAMVRVYHGLATAVFGPVALAYVTDLTPTRRGERLGYYTSATLAGRALAPIAGGAILAWGAWQWVYAVCAAAGLLTLLGMTFLPAAPAKIQSESQSTSPVAAPPQATERIPVMVILRNPNILTTSLVEAAQFLAFGALEAFLPIYALSVGVDKAVIGLFFGAQVGVRTFVRPLMGKVSDQYGRKRQILVGLALTAVSMAFFPSTRSWVVMLVLSVFFGTGLSIAAAATSAFVADIAPQNGRGTALGMMSTIMDIGQSIGPVLLGNLLVVVSYQAGFASISAIVFAAMLAFALIAQEKKKEVL
jgi:DHA1 family multidrug resistance protein-like MFS transporter